eukprot:CAMPEP_0194076418 /NCGR_PEP_ID=MMETSP0149-20130528/3209_1 /TAXON_ID=122233 /ORGANISM="Chaetoceros debilis, Strain MM31A-1" /LENGTH=491 /DNA_ID=CAMNT_0038757157 /DNA_START=53 /DNA_END=1525 /DNA_ORIENTATION=+
MESVGLHYRRQLKMGKKSKRRNAGASGSRVSVVEACNSKKSSALQERGVARAAAILTRTRTGPTGDEEFAKLKLVESRAASEVRAIVTRTRRTRRTTRPTGDEAFAKLVESSINKEEFDSVCGVVDGVAVSAEYLIELYRLAIRRKSSNERIARRVLPQLALRNLTTLLTACNNYSDQIHMIEDHFDVIECSPPAERLAANYMQIRYVRACFMSGQLIKAERYADRVFVEDMFPSMRDRDESGLLDIDQLEFKAEMLSCCAELCRSRFRLDDVIDYGCQSLQTWKKISTLDPTNEAKRENLNRRRATIHQLMAQAFGLMGKGEQSIENYGRGLDFLCAEVIMDDPNNDALAIEKAVECTEGHAVEYAKMKEWKKAEKYMVICLRMLNHHRACLSNNVNTYHDQGARAFARSGSIFLAQYEEDRKGAPEDLLDKASLHTSAALKIFISSCTPVGCCILSYVFVDKSHQEFFAGNIVAAEQNLIKHLAFEENW